MAARGHEQFFPMYMLIYLLCLLAYLFQVVGLADEKVLQVDEFELPVPVSRSILVPELYWFLF